MNAERLPLNDDHGDRFPGALPAPATAHPRHEAADDRLVRMRAAYLHKINSAVEADREDLADELATSFAHEAAALQTPQSRTRRASSGTPTRTRTGRPASRATRAGGTVRAMIRRFDRHTLEVFNAGTPTRPLD
ncbi:hypothetical protein DQ244_06515 [Blastococcus sp. TBT05-19]|uniref:hypothetical protein n=1 Tax=Blastococcus sp. TBT05-19 TaxID=2250581 RepID=UPI000DE85C1A|nr:hypothetical protein [Blastococcus sp. TBT05-19]RBY94896.1 hypothetical protein DQ244_06515 [Blastococcus sp. TBT05-19]